jgi:selenocysteine lyase/cysteine desulfurase
MSIIQPQRHLFDIPDAIAYFNCATMSPQLNQSRARLFAGVDSKCHPWERTPASFFEDAETVRRLSSTLFGGDPDGYAVVPAASYGLGTAARAIEPHLRPGHRILMIAAEFPSSVLAWRRTAEVTGATITTVPTPRQGGWAQAILEHIDKSVKVVAISSCHWTDGAYIDLPSISRACRAVGSALAVDATQSLGAMPLSMDDVKPDFLVAAGYKWLLCPYGFTLLYVAEQWRNGRPLEETWQARANADDFTALVDYCDAYMPGARRFDSGEKCTPTILPGAIAALEQIQAWGVANIADSLAAITARIAATLEELGFHMAPPSERCPHLLGARMPSHCPGNLVTALKAEKAYISQRANSIRIAPHLHVTPQDIAHLTESLCRLVPTAASHLT